MFNEDHYVPIVRWRRGERGALELVNPTLKEKMTPLIEIPPIPWDFDKEEPKRTLDEHVNNIGDQVSKVWGDNGPIFLDAYQVCIEDDEVMEDYKHPVEFIVDEIQSKGIIAIPVTGYNRGLNYQDAVKSIIQKYNEGYCLRLEDDDFEDIDQVVDWATTFFTEKQEKIDLVVDYRYVSPKFESRMVRLVGDSISSIPYLNKWRTLTYSGTAFPENLGEIKTGSDGSVQRTEWIIYKKLLNSSLERNPAFGDYIISNPEYTEIDPRVMQMAASIRYTTETEFLVFRGYSIRSRRYNGWGQALDLTKRLVAHSKFSGKHFSYGDEYIYNCSVGNVSTGNAETWRRVGTNHHLTLVMNELSNLHAASTARLS